MDNGLAKADESDLKKLDRCARLLRQIVRYAEPKIMGDPGSFVTMIGSILLYNIIIYI